MTDTTLPPEVEAALLAIARRAYPTPKGQATSIGSAPLEDLREAYRLGLAAGGAVERAALAARSGVDCNEAAYEAVTPWLSSIQMYALSNNAPKKPLTELVADALRLALATAEAQHAEREAKSLSPMDRVQAAISALNALEGVPIRFNAHDSIRGVVGALREAKDELRCALGLEGA